MELLFIYFWLKLDIFIWLSFVLAAGISVICISDHAKPVYNDTDEKRGESRRNKFFVAIFIALGIGIILPSSKDAAILVGAHYALALGKSEEGQKVMTLVRKKANEFLDEQIKGK
jgi:uncharacterized oligopeptide transporter (OPT) family protein